VILHTLEQDYTTTTRLDLIRLHLEVRPKPQRLDLVLNQPLGRILQALLMLSDTNRAKARATIMIIDHQLREEMRLARATTAKCTLVPRWIEQRDKDFSRWDV